MTEAIRTYQFMRTQQQLKPIDACTESAQFYGINFYALVDALVAANIDVQRLSIV